MREFNIIIQSEVLHLNVSLEIDTFNLNFYSKDFPSSTISGVTRNSGFSYAKSQYIKPYPASSIISPNA